MTAHSAIDPALLEVLCCPLTHQPLREADAATLARAAAAGRVLDGALVREDGLALYPVENGIAHLVPEAAIPLQPEPATDV